MLEHEEKPYSNIHEEPIEGGIQEAPEERRNGEGTEENKSAEVTQEAFGQEIPEHHEEEKVKRTQKKKKTSTPRRKEQESSADIIRKQLQKQTNYLTRLEHVLQPLQKLVKSSDAHTKLIKNMNISVKQMEKQMLQIQKAIQKGKIRKKLI